MNCESQIAKDEQCGDNGDYDQLIRSLQLYLWITLILIMLLGISFVIYFIPFIYKTCLLL